MCAKNLMTHCNAPTFKGLPWQNIVVFQTNDLIMPEYKDFSPCII